MSFDYLSGSHLQSQVKSPSACPMIVLMASLFLTGLKFDHKLLFFYLRRVPLQLSLFFFSSTDIGERNWVIRNCATKFSFNIRIMQLFITLQANLNYSLKNQITVLVFVFFLISISFSFHLEQ